MLDKLFRVHSEKNGAAMNGTASTKEGPPNGVRRALSERPTPDMLRRTDSMTAFHAQKEFQDRTVSIGNDEREYFVSGCLLLLDCARSDLERVHATVKESPTLVNFWDYDRRTPLHVASSEGRADVVKYLLAHDARPNRSDRWGGSPLDDALRRGHQATVELLRSKGARLGTADHVAQLMAACNAGDVRDVEDCLAAPGADVNVRDFVAISGARPDIRRDWDPRVVKVLTACWADEPRLRPSFRAVIEMIEAADVDVEVIVQAGLDQSVHTTKSKNLRRGSIQSRKRVAKKQPSPHGLPSFYQHQAGGNHQPPDRQQSMDNCKCTIC